MFITIFTKPECPQCAFTKKFLLKHGFDFIEVNLLHDLDAYNYVKSKGFMQAPVVDTSSDIWSGYNEAKLRSLLPTADVA